MFSDKVWNALNKATRHLQQHIGKTVDLANFGKCLIIDYTLSTQIVLKDKNNDKHIVWYDDIKEQIA